MLEVKSEFTSSFSVGLLIEFEVSFFNSVELLWSEFSYSGSIPSSIEFKFSSSVSDSASSKFEMSDFSSESSLGTHATDTMLLPFLRPTTF